METIAMIISTLGKMGMKYINDNPPDSKEDREYLRKLNNFVDFFDQFNIQQVAHKIIKDD